MMAYIKSGGRLSVVALWVRTVRLLHHPNVLFFLENSIINAKTRPTL